jgi:hypothetical protein
MEITIQLQLVLVVHAAATHTLHKILKVVQAATLYGIQRLQLAAVELVELQSAVKAME